MNIEELYAILTTLLFKLFIFDDRKDRERVYKQALRTVKHIHELHNSTIDTLDFVSNKILPLVTENKHLKKELKYLNIAAEENMEEYQKIISKIKRAIEEGGKE